MHHRCVEARGTVGKLHIARAALHGVIKQPLDVRKQRAFGGGGNAHAQGAGDVERAGVDRTARLDRRMRRLPRDQALVDLRPAVDDRAIDRRTLAGPQQNDVAGLDRCGRHHGDLVWTDELGRRLGLQSGEIAGHRAGSPLHVLFEIAPDQEEGEQHDRRVEIGVLGMADGLDDRGRERQDDADADRHIHVDVAAAQRVEGGAEEGLAGIGRGRQRDQRRYPMEEIALLW